MIELTNDTISYGLSGIYAYINNITGRIYVGQSKDIKYRLSSHECLLSKNKNIGLIEIDKDENLYPTFIDYSEHGITVHKNKFSNLGNTFYEIAGWNGICGDCGVYIWKTNNRQIRCVDCAMDRVRAKDREYKKKMRRKSMKKSRS